MTDNPYAPPAAELIREDDGDAQLPTTRTSIDLGEALAYPFQMPGWWKLYLILGLVMLVPIAGFFVLFGWQARIFDRIRAGRSGVPDLDIGTDVRRGAKVFGSLMLNTMPLFLPIYGLFFAGMGVLEFGGEEMLPVALAILLPSYLLMMVGALAMNVLIPELQRRAYLGQWLTLLRPRASYRAIRAAPTSYLLALVGMFLGNMIGSLGIVACYFGIFLSMPIGYAIATHAIAQWSMIVDDIQHQQLAQGEGVS
ncbi:MAG: hypothetical protein ACI8RZ_005452 [Myxococcota bacterium]